jgi:acyl-CoA dehydrogenase
MTPTFISATRPDSLRSACDAVVQICARNADAVDREGVLPSEALQALRSTGLLGALASQEVGGGGASLRETANMCRSLAQACAATGLIFAMHQSQLAVLQQHGGAPGWHRELLEQSVREQWLLASATTESASGGAIRSSVCFLQHSADAVALEKSGAVISYAHAADGLLITARRALDAAPADQRLLVALRGQFTLQQTSHFNPLGMRGACTERFDLKAQCPSQQVFDDVFADIMAHTLLPVSHILLASVWLGIAVSAQARAQAFLRARNRAAAATHTAAQVRLAQAENQIQQLRAHICASLTLYETPATAPGACDASRMVSFNALKVSAAALVLRVTEAALRICGFQGYMEEGEFYLSRHIRDAHSAMVMVNDDRILASLSTVALGCALERDL